MKKRDPLTKEQDLQRQIYDLTAQLNTLKAQREYQELLPVAAKSFKTEEVGLEKAFRNKKGDLVKMFRNKADASEWVSAGTTICGTLGGGGGLLAIFGAASYGSGATDGGIAMMLFGGVFTMTASFTWGVLGLPHILKKRAIDKQVSHAVEEHKRLEHKPPR